MIVEYIRYQLKTHTAAELIAAYGEASEFLRASPHCLAYELTACSEDPAALVVRIEWTDADGHIKGFRTSAEFRPFLRLIRPFFGEIAEMRHYELSDVAWRRAG